MLTKDRFYRKIFSSNRLKKFQVIVNESDLYIQADKILEKEAKEILYEQRAYIESFIKDNQIFFTSLIPLHGCNASASIIREMINSSRLADVGPMASVAGAIAHFVGDGLLKYSNEVIVENGGDLFIKTKSCVKIGIFAGKSPLSNKIGINVFPDNKPLAVCTSSGTVGHSYSMGLADAVTIISESCALADAVATSTGNRVKKKQDIEGAIEYAKTIKGVKAVLIIIDKYMGAWGELEIFSTKK